MSAYNSEKLIFGGATMAGSWLCSMGAIMTSGELRWIYVTLAVGVMTSAFLALIFRKPTESIRITVGRCGLSSMLSIFGSKAVVHFYQVGGAQDDVLLLSSIAFGVCVAGYFIGHGFLKSLNKNSEKAGSGVLDMLMLVLRALINRKAP